MRNKLRSWATGLMTGLLAWGMHGEPVISEFQAINESTLEDDTGDFSDWIEIWNPGERTVDLKGWFLTDDPDDPRRWRLPDVSLPADGYAIVFASGKDRSAPDGEWHANFKLDGDDGEYLALVKPDGQSIAVEFSPAFPPQHPDISYGFRPGNSTPLYFQTPTPGAANSAGNSGVAPAPEFSHPGGGFTDSMQLELGVPRSGPVIRYTLDGSLPGPDSARYTGPIRVERSIVVRAKSFESGRVPSRTVSRTFTYMDEALQEFDSNLPLLILNSYDNGIRADVKTTAYLTLMAPGENGRTRLTGQPEFDGRIGIELRGSSSLQFPKKSFGLETRQEEGETDREIRWLGLPEESDWVLYAPYSDKTLLRNVLAFEVSRRIGRYAPRTRFVELFRHSGSDPLNPGDYHGVYVLMEKIKRDPNRVDVAELTLGMSREPEVSGGYILKKDRLDPGDRGLLTSRGVQLGYVEPKESEISAHQQRWIQGYLTDFETALYSRRFDDPQLGYSQYIDADSFVDHHLLVEAMKNIDGYRLSTFMHKERGGKLRMGPIWDYNLSLGNADYLQGWDPAGWYFELTSGDQYPWYPRLFQDANFRQRYIDRWAGLRTNQLATSNLLALVDDIAAQIGEAQERNFERWDVLGRRVWPNWYVARTWNAEVQWMKQWISNRMDWIDGQYLDSPRLDQPGGRISPGLTLNLSAAEGSVYYTLDGSDPRREGGGFSSAARAYTVPLVLETNTRVTARARQGDDWSAPAAETYIVALPPLVITELMYHPAEPDSAGYQAGDLEFIELKNIGQTELDLAGFTFSEGIEFAFADGDVTELAPGGHVLIVKNRAAFLAHYGQGYPIAGEFAGRLANDGERLWLKGPLGETLHDFEYGDDWHPATDGNGYSLVIREATVTPSNWGDPDMWRSSFEIGGSPGGDDPTAESNRAPVIQVGSDRQVTVSTFPVYLEVTGTVHDDGLPDPPGIVNLQWTQVEGPLPASFSEADATNSALRVEAPGSYQFRLTGDDGTLTGNDDFRLTVEKESTAVWLDQMFTPEERQDPNLGQAGSDPDLDGQTNQEEHLAGTDPRDAEQNLRISSVELAGSAINPEGVRFRIPVVPGKAYQIEYSDGRDAAAWRRLTTLEIPLQWGIDDSIRMVEVLDPEVVTQPWRLYRVTLGSP